MKRDHFGSSFGILVAMAGSAVGLGNLWRFPYLVGTNGGAAFIILYLVLVFVLCLPLLYCEFVVGRRTQSNLVTAFSRYSPGSNWSIVGILGLLGAFFILSFYPVVGGWSIDYIVRAIGFEFKDMAAAPPAAFENMFQQTMTFSSRSLLFHFLYIVLAGLIVLAGIRDGIERYTKWMMPLLFVMVVIIAVRSLFLPGAQAGLDFLFKPNFSQITGQTFLNALGQAFFSLSIGCGSILTYASYVKRSENIIKLSSMTALTDTMFAIIAGTAIMPAVFAYGLSPGEGPGLLFAVLPRIFAEMPMGSWIAILFFFILFIAAITSSISLLEVLVSVVIEKLHWSRKKAVVLMTVLCWIVGIFSVWSTEIFDFFNNFSSNLILPLGGLLLVIYVGWIADFRIFEDEITNEGRLHFNRYYLRWVRFVIRYLAPLIIFVILLASLQ